MDGSAAFPLFVGTSPTAPTAPPGGAAPTGPFCTASYATVPAATTPTVHAPLAAGTPTSPFDSIVAGDGVSTGAASVGAGAGSSGHSPTTGLSEADMSVIRVTALPTSPSDVSSPETGGWDASHLLERPSSAHADAHHAAHAQGARAHAQGHLHGPSAALRHVHSASHLPPLPGKREARAARRREQNRVAQRALRRRKESRLNEVRHRLFRVMKTASTRVNAVSTSASTSAQAVR